MTDQPRRALPGHLEPIPKETLAAVGIALYGRDWVSPLAAQLGVNRVTVQRWKDGDSRVTPRIAAELDQLLADRSVWVDAARKALRPFLATPPAPPRAG